MVLFIAFTIICGFWINHLCPSHFFFNFIYITCVISLTLYWLSLDDVDMRSRIKQSIDDLRVQGPPPPKRVQGPPPPKTPAGSS